MDITIFREGLKVRLNYWKNRLSLLKNTLERNMLEEMDHGIASDRLTLRDIEKLVSQKLETALEDRIKEILERKLNINIEKLNYLVILERIIRVEEELKAIKETQNLLIKMFEARFEDINKRFEDVNKRFDDVNKRFDDMNKRFDEMNKRFDEMYRLMNFMLKIIGGGFALLGILISLIKFT